MTVQELKEIVVEANKELPRRHMVLYSWGNVSAIDRDKGIIVIKPVGIPYDDLTTENVSVVDLQGNKVAGEKNPLNPSVDLDIHRALYENFPECNAIVHTHSTYGVTFAQAGLDIPAFGTTHADYFYGDIPCTRDLTAEEIEEAYELNTGNVIVETFEGKDPMAVPGVVVKNHGPFAWGRTPAGAVYNAVVLDKVAEMAYNTMTLNPRTQRVQQYLLDKHYFRKHGANAYYGQGSEDH